MKGLSPEPLESAAIKAGGILPFDRAFAIENGPSGFDPAAPAYFPKARFLMLMKNERLAEFQTRFDDESGLFRISRDGALQIEGSLRTPDGRARIEAWIGANFQRELRGAPKILSADGHSFSDMPSKVLHMINLESAKALGEKLGRPIDPLRFRPNILIEGAPAFSELDWEGKQIRFPGLSFAGEERTSRCAATNVDPTTGARDMEIPKKLQSLFGHTDFGIYLVAKTGGRITVGDELEIRT